MSWNLITIDDIKASSKGDFGGSFDYLLGNIIIPRVGSILAESCNREDFDKKAVSELHDIGENQSSIFLKRLPVSASPTAPQVWQSSATPRVYNATTLLVEGTDYLIDYNEGVIHTLSSSFVKGLQTVKVTYTGGYLTAHGIGTPSGLRGIAIDQAKMIFDRREEIGLTSRSIEGGSIGLLRRIMPNELKEELKPWRLMNYY